MRPTNAKKYPIDTIFEHDNILYVVKEKNKKKYFHKNNFS